MHNWDYTQNDDITNNKKWFLERLLTYGFNKEKIDKDELKKYFKELRIPDNARAFFELLLWDKQY